jgi:hypothetical protein
VAQCGAFDRVALFVFALPQRWNGRELISFSAFRFVRRVNGVVSSLLTPMLAR